MATNRLPSLLPGFKISSSGFTPLFFGKGQLFSFMFCTSPQFKHDRALLLLGYTFRLDMPFFSCAGQQSGNKSLTAHALAIQARTRSLLEEKWTNQFFEKKELNFFVLWNKISIFLVGIFCSLFAAEEKDFIRKVRVPLYLL